MHDLITAAITLVFLLFLAYLSMESIKLFSPNTNNVEGLENNKGSTTTTTTSTAATGVAAGAASFADAIKSSTTKITDAALVSKYRKDYENIIINAEDGVNASMLAVLIRSPLGTDGNVTIQTLAAIKTLNDSKAALNEIMKYVDSL